RDSRDPGLWLPQIAAGLAQVAPGGEHGVIDVLRIGDVVAVAIGSMIGPGRGQELHRADGAVPGGVAVEVAAVGVRDLAHAVATVQGNADDARVDVALGGHHSAVDRAVLGLHLPDGGESVP